MCIPGSGMGIGGPGLQWFIIVPYRESCWSHLLLPLQPFSVPVLEMCATLSRQRESTLPCYYPPGSLSLPCSSHASHKHESVQKPQPKTLWWWQFTCCTHLLSGWGLSWTCPMDLISSLQANYSLQTAKREMSTTVHWIFPTVLSPLILSASVPL